MAANGDTIEMILTFERSLAKERVAERCRAIAEYLEVDDD